MSYLYSVLGFYLQITYWQVSGYQKFTYPARKFSYQILMEGKPENEIPQNCAEFTFYCIVSWLYFQMFGWFDLCGFRQKLIVSLL